MLWKPVTRSFFEAKMSIEDNSLLLEGVSSGTDVVAISIYIYPFSVCA